MKTIILAIALILTQTGTLHAQENAGAANACEYQFIGKMKSIFKRPNNNSEVSSVIQTEDGLLIIARQFEKNNATEMLQYNTTTGKITRFELKMLKNEFWFNQKLSKDKKSMFGISFVMDPVANKTTLRLINVDLKSGKQTAFESPITGNPYIFDNGALILGADNMSEVGIVNTLTGKTGTIKLDSEISSMEAHPAGENGFIFEHGDESITYVNALKATKKHYKKFADGYSFISGTDKHAYFYKSTAQENGPGQFSIMQLDLKTGAYTSILELPSSYYADRLNSKSTWLQVLPNNQSDASFLFNPATGERIPVSTNAGDVPNINYVDENSIYMYSRTGGSYILDLTTKSRTDINFNSAGFESPYVYPIGEPANGVMHFNISGAINNNHTELVAKVNLKSGKIEYFMHPGGEIHPINGKLIRSNDVEISEVRFIKPIGPSPRQTLPTFENLSSEGISKLRIDKALHSFTDYMKRGGLPAKPELLAAYYAKLYNYSPITAKSFVDMHMRQVTVSAFELQHKVAVDKKLIPVIEKVYKGILNDIVQSNRGNANESFEHFKHVFFLSNYAKYMPKEITLGLENNLANIVTRNIQYGGGRVPGLETVFQPALFKFTKQYVRKMLGRDYRSLTDLAVLQVNENELTPLILGVGQINSTTVFNSGTGMHVLGELPAIPLTKDTDGFLQSVSREFAWTHNGESYTAQVNVKAIRRRVEDFLPKSPKISYKNGKPDAGIVVVGDNLNGDGDMILDEYLSYFQEQGFKFGKDSQKVDDVAVFMKEKIESGEIDYLVKEAHTDGDVHNLFRYVKKGHIRIGTKTHSDGHVERIYLVDNARPDDAGFETSLIPNGEFASWINARSKNSQGTFLYMNTSCYADQKVVSELQTTANPDLIVIGGRTTMNTFTNEPDVSGIYSVLHGIRNAQEFSKIREELAKTANYKGGEDHFLFPDEDEFEQYVRSKIKIPYDLTVTIKDSKGRTFEIDNAPLIQPQ